MPRRFLTGSLATMTLLPASRLLSWAPSWLALPYLLRKQLGRSGALVASFLLLISPSLLFYSRYIRHDIPVIVWSMLVAWSSWRYLGTREAKYLYWLAGGLSLMFATKEVAYLYVAIFGSFLVVRFVVGLLTTDWPRPAMRGWFQIALIALWSASSYSGSPWLVKARPSQHSGGLRPDEGTTLPEDAAPGQQWKVVQIAAGIILGGSIVLAIYAAVTGMKSGRLFGEGRTRLRDYPEFDLIVLYGTLLLPFMGALPVSWLAKSFGLEVTWSSMQVSSQLVYVSAATMIVLVGLSIAAGVLWDWRRWLVAAGSFFYVIFVVLYTTVFTNSRGFATGWLGSLGYWLEQQGVERGSQPWYFYLWVVPIYEFLPLLGAVAAGLLWAVRGGGLNLLSRLLYRNAEFTDEHRRSLFGFVPFVIWWTIAAWLSIPTPAKRWGG